MLLRTGLTALVCILSLTSIYFVVRLYRGDHASSIEWVAALSSNPSTVVDSCPDQLDWLRPLELTYPVQYARRDIVVKPTSAAKRLSVTRLAGPLFPDFQTLDLTDDPAKIKLERCQEPLVLDVPEYPSEPADASHITFGISTTLRRLDDSIPSLVRWLRNTHAQLYVVVIEDDRMPEESKDAYHPADSKKMSDLESRMRSLGIDATLVHPLKKDHYYSQRYFSLLRIMFDHRDKSKTQWLSFFDDDTFLLSMPSLLTTLASYDHTQNFYIGGLSEDWWSVTRYGMMAFGGAGVFVSIALADIVNSHYDECQERSLTSAGDIRLKECIGWNTRTKLTNIMDLHQIDVHNDLSGVYESGRLPLTLHHWKGGGPDGKGYDLASMHLVADICGDCVLQRWQFGKDLLLVNGFSISTYPKGHLKEVDLENVEETWDQPSIVEGSFNRGTDHSFGPTRPKLQLGEEKVQYRLLESRAMEGIGVRQIYFRTAAGEEAMDSVLELVWMQDGGRNSMPEGAATNATQQRR